MPPFSFLANSLDLVFFEIAQALIFLQSRLAATFYEIVNNADMNNLPYQEDIDSTEGEYQGYDFGSQHLFKMAYSKIN